MVDPTFNKSAETRFENTKRQAQRNSMPMNQAAQQSLRNMKSGGRPSGPPVVPQFNPSDLLSPMQVQQQPVGNTPVMPPIETNPAILQENLVSEVINAVKQQKFLNSPQVKDAMTSIRLRNIFNSTNPVAMPDNRDLLSRITSRIKGGGA